MWVESAGTPNQGSTFHFTLIVQGRTNPSWRYLKEPQPAFQTKSVGMLVDNPSLRQQLASQLKTWGMTAQALPVPEALTTIRYQSWHGDLLILDQSCFTAEPDFSEILTTDRADPPGIPCLILTPFGEGPPRQKISNVRYLNKPIKPAQLYQRLQQLLAPQIEGLAVPQTLAEPTPLLAAAHPLRILLAEDNRVNQKVTLRLLAQFGYQADVAVTGLEVLALLDQQRYDLILMDVQMPELNGLETTQRIRAEWPSATQPQIIALTASAMPGDRETILQAGLDHYLSKPIEIEALVAALRDCRPLGTGTDKGPTRMAPP
jgi:CheY-like chemotaxis protein